MGFIPLSPATVTVDRARQMQPNQDSWPAWHISSDFVRQVERPHPHSFSVTAHLEKPEVDPRQPRPGVSI